MEKTDPLVGAIGAVRERHTIHNLRHILEIIARVERGDSTLEKITQSYFRSHPKLGSSDRALIGDVVIATYRWKKRLHNALLQTLAQERPTGLPAEETDRLIPGGALIMSGYDAGVVTSAYHRVFPSLGFPPRFWEQFVSGVLSLNPWESADPDQLAVRASLPDWVTRRLTQDYGFERARSLAIALQTEAPIALRNNDLRQDRDRLIAEFLSAGVAVVPTMFSPWGIRLSERREVRRLPGFDSGAFDIQDEGSQLVALATGAASGMVVVDACAGAGGKSLALGAMMQNKGRIVAFDPNEAKLEELRVRAARAGVRNVRIQRVSADPEDVPHDGVFRRLVGHADVVLVDAPCSGSGTARRNPDIWGRITPKGVTRYARMQRRLLETYSRLVRPRGRLAYATCSLFQEENREVAEGWLRDAQDFISIPVDQNIPGGIAASVCEGAYLNVFPDIHGTDGFFVAVFERKAGP
ncbi:MAG: Ribosomal RNA small subunit methyltransferase F [Candidatus Latescibacteria bacterium ADurb.Bin168]|nr:MAG: Ribosomal RNA small subunit methyltransferase F [Candidatus Latescibacteria bacterium ADurb.Bin168]